MPTREEIHTCVEKLLTSTISGGNVAATLTTTMTGSDNDIKLTARVGGSGGNSIQLALVDPSGNNQSLAVTVAELVITASLATGSGGAITTTADQLIAAINADATAKMLVTAALPVGAVGTGIVTALTATNLTGGDASVVTSSAIDCLGFGSAHFNLHIGTTLAAGLTYKITESDDDSTYTDAAATDVVDDAPTPVANKTIRVAYVGKKRYAKVVVTPGGATDLTITGHAGYAHSKPTANPA